MTAFINDRSQLFLLLLNLLAIISSTVAFYGSMVAEVDVDELPNASLVFISPDADNEHLRFLGFEQHLAFVGGRNTLTLLNMSASIERNQLVRREVAFPIMNASQDCFDSFVESEAEVVCRSTFVRALLRRPDQSVVLCGIGAFEPRCWLCVDASKKLLHKASDLYQFTPSEYSLELIGSGEGIVPFEPNSNFTYFVSDDKIYSGIYESPEVNSAIYKPVVVSRSLSDFDFNVSHKENFDKNVIAESASLSRPQFIGSLNSIDTYGYMFFNEQGSAKVGQFCKSGPSAVGTTGFPVSASFYKAFLFCGFHPQRNTLLSVESLLNSANTIFNFEQLAGITDLMNPIAPDGSRYFYGAFNRHPSKPTSIGICLFEESDIRKTFAESPFIRLQSEGGVSKPVLPVTYATEYLSSRPNNCSAKFSESEKIALHNFRVKFTTIYRLATMKTAEPIFFDTTVSYRLTTIAVDWQPKLGESDSVQHMLFVGTSDGSLLKIAVTAVSRDESSFNSPAIKHQPSRLLSRITIFAKQPVTHLSTWPPGYGRSTPAIALLVLSKTSVGLHVFRSSKDCGRSLSTYCTCFAEGYPHCRFDKSTYTCIPLTGTKRFQNDTFTCDPWTFIMSETATSEKHKVGQSTSSNDNTMTIVIVVCCFMLCSAILIAVFIYWRRKKYTKARTYSQTHRHQNGINHDAKSSGNVSRLVGSNAAADVTSSRTFLPSSKKVQVVSVATEMTPQSSPKLSPRQMGAGSMNYFHAGTLGNKPSSRYYFQYMSLTSTMKSKSLNDLEEDSTRPTTDEDDCSPSPPVGDNQSSRMTPPNDDELVRKSPAGNGRYEPSSIYPLKPYPDLSQPGRFNGRNFSVMTGTRQPLLMPTPYSKQLHTTPYG